VPTDSQRASSADIVRLLNLYGHITDAKEWSRYNEIFTEDVVVDSSDLKMPPMVGLPGLISVFQATVHPVAHHVTNVVVEWGEDEHRATVLSKWMGVREDGTVATGDYTDVAVRGPSGWRIAERRASMRRQHQLPETSRGGRLTK
jgi:hypothetical protein